MLLIRGCEVYSPDPMGRASILTGGERILGVGDFSSVSAAEVFDAGGTIALPGFIDPHVHLIGGGGEGGFKTRTPEAALTSITTAGVTTVIGVLGTDCVTRSSEALVAKIRGLEEEGVSAWGLLGSYRIPFGTITGSVQRDLVMIDKFIGVGEVAISDHRSSQPTFEEFARLAADTRLGCMLSGKAGVVQCHMGDGRRMLELILRVVDETEIPIEHFVPTHMNRNPYLFKEGIDFALRGGCVDCTTSTDPIFFEEGETKCSVALKTLLDAAVPVERITFSSDGQGSLPAFDDSGNLAGLTIGDCRSLWPEVRDAVRDEKIPLETALRVITSNPADIYKLRRKGRVREDCDADITFVDQDSLEIRHVIARGRVMVRDGEAVVKGTFEK
ncbi:MAG: beta-aspartyl-peptidase [Synergistaceae bacterium]|jgi:beta-aspartyl-dipeptidase (metallo-type)|nr:beta-aspartyl-peptidase [Synergistaceae bacterium]